MTNTLFIHYGIQGLATLTSFSNFIFKTSYHLEQGIPNTEIAGFHHIKGVTG